MSSKLTHSNHHGAGIAVATRAEPSFHLLGFLLSVGATCARAFKSILQVSLLHAASLSTLRVS